MSTKYAIVGGKLIDGTGAEPVENSLVLVDDNGKIEYAGVMQDLPEGVEVIDAAGKTVLPGLIDTHLHFSGNLTDDDTDWVMQPLLEKQAVAVKQAYDCLTHGLTTVCEIGRFGIQIRDCIDKGVFKGPRVLATGLGFCRVAGHGDSHHCTQELNKESHPWGDQVDGPWDLRKAVRRRLRENPDAIKIWATGGGIWRWDSGRDQHYCSEEIQAVVEEAKMVGIPVWSHCYNNHAAAYDSVRFGCEQLIHGFDIDERTMDLMAEQGTFFTPTIAFLPTWYATYPPVYVPELHDKYEGTLVEKELQRNYDCLREAKKRGVVMTIGSDSFSFVTPYGTCSIEEMYEFVDKIGFTPVETITCASSICQESGNTDHCRRSWSGYRFLCQRRNSNTKLHPLCKDKQDCHYYNCDRILCRKLPDVCIWCYRRCFYRKRRYFLRYDRTGTDSSGTDRTGSKHLDHQ